MIATTLQLTKRLGQQLDSATVRFIKARSRFELVHAEALRVHLADVAERHPGFKSVWFEIENVWDSGESYEVTNWQADVDYSVEGEEDAAAEHGSAEDEVLDYGSNFDHRMGIRLMEALDIPLTHERAGTIPADAIRRSSRIV